MSVPITAQATFAATLVDEWVRSGVTDAVVCPGSRSTPLVEALANRRELRLHVRLDERSASFFAVGLSLANERPTVICTTSGTAAAELHPGVVEARYAGVALIVYTADRPRRLQDVGSPQTIDQVGIFGSSVVWSFDTGSLDADDTSWWRSLGSRVAAEALHGPKGPGPVHLNLRFDDPLLGASGPLPAARPGSSPWHRVLAPDASAPEVLVDSISSFRSKRGLLVAGAGCGPAAELIELAAELRWPLLADPRSGCRQAHSAVVAAADSFLRDPSIREALLPEVVVLLGSPWASKVLADFLHEAHDSGAEMILVDPFGRWIDPGRIAAQIHRVDPGSWVQLANATLSGSEGGGRSAKAMTPNYPDEDPPVRGREWCDIWTTVEAAAQVALDEALAKDAIRSGDALSEPSLARSILDLVPAESTVFVSSSMPVRDLEWFARPMQIPPRVLSNRGANGIDGTCSAARGVAAAGRGPVVALVGDLAFLHDATSLLGSSSEGGSYGGSLGASHGGSAGGLTPGSCTLVVLDNDGGAIFSFLPQARDTERERFEDLYATPQRVSVSDVARGFGLDVADVTTLDELENALNPSASASSPRLSVVRVGLPNREENARLHSWINESVVQAVRGALQL